MKRTLAACLIPMLTAATFAVAQEQAPSVQFDSPAMAPTEAPADDAAPLLETEEAVPTFGTEAPVDAPAEVAPYAATEATDPAPVPADAAAPAADVAPAAEPAPVADPVPAEAEPALPPTATSAVADAYTRAERFLVDGGPAIWAIAALSVVTIALILWKIWRFLAAGAWSRSASRRAVATWEDGRHREALELVRRRKGVRSRMVTAAMTARLARSDAAAREETTRVARGLLASQSGGLRALELIATIAPLLGLLGTVLGMISAFQALQEAGNRADPALLAGGIWEALLTTAAGMAVAIPASAALTWFEAVIDSLRQDMEDLSTRIFVAAPEDEDARIEMAAE